MKTILTFVLCFFSAFGFAQQKSYVTKTIGSWKFEKFPAHYYVTPFKADRENSISGKLVQYSETNNLGQPIGLLLTMRVNGINPSSATYSHKGQIVYMANFFPNSNVIERISNMNEQGDDDGPQITRTLKGTGGYTEDIMIYENGELKSRNGVKITAMGVTYNKDSLLNGTFKFKNRKDEIYEGKAINGKVVKIKQAFIDPDNPGYIDVTLDSTSFLVKCYEDLNCSGSSSFPLYCKILLTNSINKIKKNSFGTIEKNYYIYVDEDSFSIVDFINILKNCKKN